MMNRKGIYKEDGNMFRKMRRFKQQLTQEECVEVLKGQVRGVLSVHGEDGYPYGLPINYWYNEADGNFYFHCAKTGHKIDAIAANDKVSLCVYDEGYRKEGDWALNIRSVIVFGRMSTVEDMDRKLEICRGLVGNFPAEDGYAEDEFNKLGKVVNCLQLTPDHMTGKLVNES